MTAPMATRRTRIHYEKHSPLHHLQPTPEETTKLQAILEQLTKQEMETAANASYEYLTTRNNNKNQNLETHYAKQYALRYLRAKDGDQAKTLQRLQATLQFRHAVDVDGIRTAFDTHNANHNNNNNNLEYAKKLEHELQAKNVYVQGYDKDGRATYIFVPRNVRGHDDAEWTLKEHIYTLERAIASSRAEDSTVNAVVDCQGFSLQHAPPTAIGKAFMNTFRHHYAGAIQDIFLVDAPLSFRCLWKVFRPLIGEKTRRKIHFVQSSDDTLREYYDASQAAAWMMRGGQKNRDLDLHEYLYETKFDQAFDES